MRRVLYSHHFVVSLPSCKSLNYKTDQEINQQETYRKNVMESDFLNPMHSRQRFQSLSTFSPSPHDPEIVDWHLRREKVEGEDSYLPRSNMKRCSTLAVRDIDIHVGIVKQKFHNLQLVFKCQDVESSS